MGCPPSQVYHDAGNLLSYKVSRISFWLFPVEEFRHQVRSRRFGTEAVSLAALVSKKQCTDSGSAGKAHFLGGRGGLASGGRSWLGGGEGLGAPVLLGSASQEDKPGSMPRSTAEAQNHPKAFPKCLLGTLRRVGSLGPGRALASICDKALRGWISIQLTSSKQERQQRP